ncbi:DNA primase [Ichthyobacterium seriolicida]|uniref:DNA primase n=1 Tax=Ichthyobacterium seriolicida TaxID=242600 RepID=A0A1J1E1R3_9FLAO|nr:DNA primase [Ichthyobacterium seriolicida]BAV94893.1 DNA primase [Ichthyobacterium seriolicida]
MISQETIDEVFSVSNIEEVISDFITLKKSGQNYKGLSPFSNEKTPSFVVSPSKQIFKCFSSNKGGNVISFLMEHEHFTYPEAIKYLAKKYGIEVKETQRTEKEIIEKDEMESMFSVSEFAQSFFEDSLHNTTEGENTGLTYLEKRGFSIDIIKKFHLGYSPNQWDYFTKTALKKGFNISFLEKTGLTIVKEEMKIDRFKGRVIFPIHSMSGRVMGFGGRDLTDNKNTAKYLNSIDSLIYKKHKILYGLYHAKKHISKEDNCLLVEGYTDVISLYQRGIKNVVSSSGTALSEEQIILIKRLTNNITIVYDGDEAGIRASFKGMDIMLEQGIDVQAVILPEGEDPDSYSRKQETDAVINYLKTQSTDFITFKINTLAREDLENPIKKSQLVKDIVLSISKIPDSIKREIYIKECSKLMNISENNLFKEEAQLLYQENEKSEKRQEKEAFRLIEKTQDRDDCSIKHRAIKDIERNIIKLLLLNGNEEILVDDIIEFKDDKGELKTEIKTYKSTVAQEICYRINEDELEFFDERFRKIFVEVCNLLDQNKEINSEYFCNSSDREISEVTANVLITKYSPSPQWEEKNIFSSRKQNISSTVMEMILKYKSARLSDIIAEEKKRLSEEEDQDFKSKIIHSITKLIVLQKKINSELGRIINI